MSEPTIYKSQFRNLTNGDNVKVVEPVNSYYVTIGNKCFVSQIAMFINGSFSAGGIAGTEVTKWKASKIGNHKSIGTNNTKLSIEIYDNVDIGAGSVVTKNMMELL